MTRPRLIGARRATMRWLAAYGALIIAAEAAAVLVGVATGMLMHATILVLLLAHNAFARPPRDPILPVLALLPVIRLLSIAVPIPAAEPLTISALVGAPALLGAVLTARAIGVSRADLGLGWPSSKVVPTLVAAIGLPLGLVARSVLVGLAPLPTGAAPPVLAVLVLVPFVVFLEEIVFRALLPRAVMARPDVRIVAGSSLLYAAMYFGSGSPPVVLFMGLTGALFGLVAGRTGSLWGVLGAHLVLRLVVQF